MAFDIVALGEPLYELNQQPDGRFLGGFGGDTSNVAIAAARLGAKTAYVTRLGEDVFGAQFAALWRREGVDASAVTIDRQAPTGLYFVTHDGGGHHFTYRRRDSAASLIRPADLPRPMLGATKFLHVSAISQAISASAAETVREAIGLARQGGARLCFDTNYRPQLWSPKAAWAEISKAAAEAHILKTSIEDSSALFGGRTPSDIAQAFRHLGSDIVLVTLGANGVHVATAEGAATHRGRAVAAIDATGAGDAFTGALLAELSRGEELDMAVRFATAAAALSTLGYGAIAPLPQRSEVEAFLA